MVNIKNTHKLKLLEIRKTFRRSLKTESLRNETHKISSFANYLTVIKKKKNQNQGKNVI